MCSARWISSAASSTATLAVSAAGTALGAVAENVADLSTPVALPIVAASFTAPEGAGKASASGVGGTRRLVVIRREMTGRAVDCGLPVECCTIGVLGLTDPCVLCDLHRLGALCWLRDERSSDRSVIENIG